MQYEGGKHMAFVFSRVDDRAIHGQTVTMWSKVYQNSGILLIDDEISNDPMMRQIYKNAAVGMNVYIYTVQDAIIKAKQAAQSAKSYLLIARSPLVFEKLEKGGVDIGKKLTLGPVSQGDGRKLVAQFTSLSEEEIQACHYLSSKGIEIVFQNIPSTQPVDWKSIRF